MLFFFFAVFSLLKSSTMTDEVNLLVHETLPIFLYSRVLMSSFLQALFETHYSYCKPQIMANTAISEGMMMLLFTF